MLTLAARHDNSRQFVTTPLADVVTRSRNYVNFLDFATADFPSWIRGLHVASRLAQALLRPPLQARGAADLTTHNLPR
jgi:hypothetical protein